MDISKKGLDFIANFEGCHLEAYHDSGGVLTIGYGHTGKDVKEGDKLTKADALKLLKADLKKYAPKKAKTQAEYDALVSYHFNCGNGASEELKKRMNIIFDAKRHMLKGLIRRRIAETILIEEGIYDMSMTPLAGAVGRQEELVKYGDRGYKVAMIQQACRIVNGLGTSFVIDGIFGGDTLSEVKKMQGALGVRRDGVVGDVTRKALVKELMRRIY